MVQFSKGSFTITVHTTDKPENEFNSLLEDMFDLLQSKSSETSNNHFYFLELMKAMTKQQPAVSSN